MARQSAPAAQADPAVKESRGLAPCMGNWRETNKNKAYHCYNITNNNSNNNNSDSNNSNNYNSNNALDVVDSETGDARRQIPEADSEQATEGHCPAGLVAKCPGCTASRHHSHAND